MIQSDRQFLLQYSFRNRLASEKRTKQVCVCTLQAFCAGGDVKSVITSAKEGDWASGSEFFCAEYCMNYLIGQMPLPQIALIDGIVMGGGAGLSMHGPFRVATERCVHSYSKFQTSKLTVSCVL